MTGLLTTVALTALITDAVKIGIGRPRPHFYARCFGSTTANAVSRSYFIRYLQSPTLAQVADSREFDCRLMMQSGTSFAWQLQTSWKKRTRASLVAIPHVSTVATHWLGMQFSNECNENDCLWLCRVVCWIGLLGDVLGWQDWYLRSPRSLVEAVPGHPANPRRYLHRHHSRWWLLASLDRCVHWSCNRWVSNITLLSIEKGNIWY